MMSVDVQDPLDELEHENEVSEKLVERLAEVAIELKEGRSPPPGEIAEGLRLLEQYRRVHAERVDHVLRPEARPVAMNTCFRHLDAITKDHGTEAERIERARRALEEVRRDLPEARTRLAQALADLTEKDHESLNYENDYPLSCLRSVLPDAAAARVAEAFGQTATEITDLEGHIARYLELVSGTPVRGLTVRCRRASCQANSESHVVPSADGRLGIEVPVGWQVISQPPVSGEDGTIRLKVDFCCPAHHEERTLGTPIDEGVSVSSRERTEDLEPGDCCGPIPQDAR
jgi:hemerythrin-like domain-containing protein